MIPVVSIITPTYNSEKFIGQTIESVIGQTFSNWEMLIVDDCSSDNTEKVVQSYSLDDPRIKFRKLEKNSGAAVARNTAIGLAQGRYIAFLDSDDLWMTNKLEKQLSFMEKTQSPFSYSSYKKVNEFGEVIGSVGVPEKVNYHNLLKTCVIGCLTSIYDTKYFGKVEMPLIRKRQDFGLWLRLLKKTPYAYGINEELALYRVRGDSISANKKSAAIFTWKLYREVEKLPLYKAIYYFSHYAIKGLLRSKFPKIAKFLGVMN